jgi:hypothetical protein
MCITPLGIADHFEGVRERHLIPAAKRVITTPCPRNARRMGRASSQARRGSRGHASRRKLRLNPSHELLNEGVVPLTNDGALHGTHGPTSLMVCGCCDLQGRGTWHKRPNRPPEDAS